MAQAMLTPMAWLFIVPKKTAYDDGAEQQVQCVAEQVWGMAKGGMEPCAA